MPAPYPGYPPNYEIVKKTGDYTRNCIVLELRSLGPLTNVQLAIIQEQLEASLAKIVRQIPTIEGVDTILSSRFDSILRKGLRLQ